jgi:hypothetical protein
VEATITLAQALKGAEKDPSELALFRSDGDLTRILREIGSWDRERFLAALASLRHFQCLSRDRDLAESYGSLLSSELKAGDSYRISAVLALATHLFQAEAVSDLLEKLFLEALSLEDKRIKANAIEIFIHFFPEREIPELRRFLRDIDNRVSANALVKAALERFDEGVVRKIEERLHGGSVAHVASALYALGEIALYYRKTDPLYLGTKATFLRIFDSFPEWITHPNPMVRRQALVAANKLADRSLDQRLRRIFEESRDPGLRELFASVYGWGGDLEGKRAA